MISSLLKPPEGAVQEKHKLCASWSVFKKRKTDPDHKSFPRLNFTSTNEVETVLDLELTNFGYKATFDLERKGMWLALFDLDAVRRKAANKFTREKGKNQTRVAFWTLSGVYKKQGVEIPAAFVEVWSYTYRGKTRYWIFADMSSHTELLQRFKGKGVL